MRSAGAAARPAGPALARSASKFSKTITTFFFPVGDIFKQILIDWVNQLRTHHAWGVDDPLFPATRIELGESTGLFEARRLLRQHWSTAAPVRRIFRHAFASVGLPYFNPHSFRRTLALEGERRCRSIEELKAWSQNLGHDGLSTTLTTYGQIPIARQAELIVVEVTGGQGWPVRSNLQANGLPPGYHAQDAVSPLSAERGNLGF